MFSKVFRQCLKAIIVAENGVHGGAGFFTFVDLPFIGTGVSALFVVLFHLFQLAGVEDDLRRAAFVDDAHRDLILNGFGHGIAVDDVAKDFHRGVDRGAGKTNVGGLRQGVVQIFGETVSFAHSAALFIDDHFLIEVDLAAVRFVGNTDDIAAPGEQFGIFGKFVDGGQEDAAAVATGQFFPQIIAAGDGHYGVVANIVFGIAHLCRELIVQVGAVGDQHDSRAGELDAFHQQAG